MTEDRITPEFLRDTARSLSTPELERVLAKQVAGDGAGTEAHQIAVAELARRANENAPGAAATATEGQDESANQEEGETVMAEPTVSAELTQSLLDEYRAEQTAVAELRTEYEARRVDVLAELAQRHKRLDELKGSMRALTRHGHPTTWSEVLDRARLTLAARDRLTAPEDCHIVQVATVDLGEAVQVMLGMCEETDEAGRLMPPEWEVTISQGRHMVTLEAHQVPALVSVLAEYVAIMQAVAAPTMTDLVMQARREGRPVRDVAAELDLDDDRSIRRDENAVRAAAELREDTWT